jgi:hypothetical protein
MQFYGISFMHPYKQSSQWQDVLDKVINFAFYWFFFDVHVTVHRDVHVTVHHDKFV